MGTLRPSGFRERGPAESGSGLLAVLILACVLGGCAGEEPRPRAPAFELASLDEQLRALEDRDVGVLVVNFWASWCAPCRKEMPELNRLHADYRDRGVAVWGISVDALAEDAREFVGETGVDYPILMDSDMEVAEAYEVHAMPSTLIIDQNNRIRQTWLGYDPELVDEIEQRIEALLAEPDND